jgi:hypothetical protein
MHMHYTVGDALLILCHLVHFRHLVDRRTEQKVHVCWKHINWFGKLREGEKEPYHIHLWYIVQQNHEQSICLSIDDE